MRKKLSALNYFGGKTQWLDWLLPILDVPHKYYLEPCCGSAVVFLNKRHAPIDPTYDHEERSGKTDYKHEFTKEQHIQLADIGEAFKGYFAVSGYMSKLYKKLYRLKEDGGKWYLHYGPKRNINMGINDNQKRECVWTNYQIVNKLL